MSLSFILAMAWKSAVISGAALLLLVLLRKRAAADRAALLRAGVLLLLLLPLVSILLPALTIETAPEAGVPFPSMTAAQLAALAAAAPDPAPISIWQQTELLAGLAYASGLLLIGLRFAAGLLTLRRWTRGGRQVTSAAWTNALVRHVRRGKATPLLIASQEVAAPISWGLFQPVILLDPESVERTEEADAVLAHELAHVARRDWLSLVLARAAVALFWFNPLVWLLEREVVQHAEEAADRHALEQVEAVRYAETLVTCAQRCGRSRVPANSMAGSGRRLARRVRAVLEGNNAPSGSRWTAAAIIGCVALTAPVAALQLVEGARPAPPQAPPALPAPQPPAAVLSPSAPPAPATAMAAQAPSAVQAPAPPLTAAPVLARQDGLQIEIDEDAIERAAEAAEEAAERAADHAERIAERASLDAERMAASAERISARAMKSGTAAQAAGANAMLQGAESMEAGARQMDQAAAKLRSKDYREREIARSAAQGKRVTHEELLRAIPELQQGAREMREGAREMRAGAAEMRRQGT
ncbi:MAG TPA: M56 family metallopeptidase [Allosphingosinicella sp.]|jgi:beta-lactamase regulating signal transducer with metallopeptidase domain